MNILNEAISLENEAMSLENEVMSLENEAISLETDMQVRLLFIILVGNLDLRGNESEFKVTLLIG